MSCDRLSKSWNDEIYDKVQILVMQDYVNIQEIVDEMGFIPFWVKFWSVEITHTKAADALDVSNTQHLEHFDY